MLVMTNTLVTNRKDYTLDRVFLGGLISFPNKGYLICLKNACFFFLSATLREGKHVPN